MCSKGFASKHNVMELKHKLTSSKILNNTIKVLPI